MADESQNKLASQSSISRARRIRDEEWEARRPEIGKLYQEQGYSRNAVIEKLSQDGFPVTEKQLKHILKKWGTKKKVSSTDMQDMLAVKRKRNEDGKTTEFMYYGHVVAEAKLCRAEKKYKIAPSSNVALPSYIKASSPNPTNRSPLPSLSIAQNSGIDNLLPSSTHPSPPRHKLLEEAYISAADQQRITFAPNEADLGASFLQNSENEPSWHTNVGQTDHTEEALPLYSPRSFTPMINSDLDLAFLMEPLANNTNPLINVSQASSMSPFANSPSRPVFYPRLPTPVPNSVITSPLATPMDLDRPAVFSDGYQPSSRFDLEPMSLSSKVIFYGTDPESIIPSIQMMRKMFHRLQDDTFRNQHVSSWGMCKWKLHREIRSEVLLSGIDEIAVGAYQASAKMVQQQIAARQSSCMDIQSFSQRRDKNHEQMSQVQAWNVSNEGNSARLDGTLISYCDIRTDCTTGGTFQIQLRRAPKEVSDCDEDESQITLAISVIPKIRKRAKAGIYVTIPTIPGISRGVPIYTTIRSFNVVPRDSEIVNCVLMNDLDGVRRLIREKKASTRDVDPWGISLLGYAMFSGCSETFQLLLRGGASTDQCDMFGHPTNLIDSIWSNYILLAISGGVTSIIMAFLLEVEYKEFSNKYITDLGQCRSMTELAIANGCLAEEFVPHAPRLLTPLFELSDITRLETTRCQVADVLKQLLCAGYDKEFQNNTGKTPLLHAAFSLQLRSLTVLELLLAEDTNIHAVDNDGRGALHLCLLFSQALQESFVSVCRGSISARNNRFVAEHLTTTDVSGGRGFDLQHNDSNLQEVLPPDDCDSYIDEKSDMNSADYDGEGLSNDTEDSLWPQECYWCGENNGIRGEDWSYGARFYYCEERDIDDFNMPEAPDPEPKTWMCKARSRLKLLALLKAGCCPNIPDGEGLSPSDYARAEGLWPQWEWALSTSGFQHNEHTGLWERES